MTTPFFEVLMQLERPRPKSALEAILGPRPQPVEEIREEPEEAPSEDRTSDELARLEEARFRYLQAIESLVEHLEAKTYDPTEIVDLATMVAEAILGRTLAADRALLIERVSEALDALEGERPMRLRLSPMDRKLLAEERPDLLARALEIVEDERIGTGGCIVEGTNRAIDATVEGRLERFSRALKQRLMEADDAAR